MAPRLHLHALAPADLAFVRQLATDDRVTRYVGNGRPWTDGYLRTRFDQALHPERGGSDHAVRWYIADDPAGVPVGLLALTVGPTATVIGYWVDPAAWGRGHAGALVTAAEQLCNPQLPLVAVVHRDNTASRRVLERAGFALDVTVPTDAAELTYRRSAPPSD